MTYYLNPYVIIVKRGNSCFYQFDNSLYYLTLKEYEMLINLSENQNKFSQERLIISLIKLIMLIEVGLR